MELDFDETLGDAMWAEDPVEDEIAFRIGARQVSIREEDVEGLDGVFDIITGVTKAVTKAASNIVKPKRRRRRRRPSKPKPKPKPKQSSTRRRRRRRRKPAAPKPSQRQPQRRRRPSGRGPATFGPRAGVEWSKPKTARFSDRAAERMMALMAGAKMRGAQKRIGTPGTLEPHLAKMARQLEANLDPKLKAITKRLRSAGIQRTATSEHNAINKRAGYRRRVLKLLGKILTQCPEGDPRRERAVSVLGNVLGPAGLVIARPR